MDRTYNQDILQADCLIIKNYVRNLGYEILLNADPDDVYYLEKEDLITVIQTMFKIMDVSRLCRLLVAGEVLLISENSIKTLQPNFENKFVDLSLGNTLLQK